MAGSQLGLLSRVFRCIVPGLARPWLVAERSFHQQRTPQEVQPVAQVRGVLAERVVISTPLDPFLSLLALASYSGLSRRKLRDCLTDPAHPLPCYRIGGKIVVRRSEYDAWPPVTGRLAMWTWTRW